MAEALLNHLGQGRFKAYSAGSSPRENQQPNPTGLKVLTHLGVATAGLHSKSWEIFSQPDAPVMDLIITVCDNAAGEVCPIWPGHPATAHWGYADPSAVAGGEQAMFEAFQKTARQIKHRLELLISLPDEKLEHLRLETTARELANHEHN